MLIEICRELRIHRCHSFRSLSAILDICATELSASQFITAINPLANNKDFQEINFFQDLKFKLVTQAVHP